MYSLQKISKNELNAQEIIKDFYADLPKKPYCTHQKGMCYIRTKQQAITHAYIQPNHPSTIKWLVFDLDDEQSLLAFYDRDCPHPQMIIRNPANGHAHYCYKLSIPVGMVGKSSEKAIRYLEAVYKALGAKLGADTSYAGHLIKNPLHEDWDTYLTGAKKSYTLGELAEHLDLSSPRTEKTADNDDYFGRNCAVFHRTRHQAYAIAHRYDYSHLLKEVLSIVIAENSKFDEPMQMNELKHIAKSITRYCKSAKFVAYSKRWFSQLQAYRGQRGGIAKGKRYHEKRLQVIQLAKQGGGLRWIAEQVGVSKSAVSNYLRSYQGYLNYPVQVSK